MVALEQIVGAGLRHGAVEKAIRSGRLHRLHRGVYAVGHVPVTPHARWTAAVLACGPGAVLSHRSAATLWRIRESETRRTEVTIAPGSGRRRPGIAIHRAPLRGDDFARRDAIPVTAPERTLIDLTPQVDDDEVARAVREALYRRLTSIPSLQRALARRPCRRLGAQIAGYADTRSRLEDEFMRLLDAAGIPRPLRQHLVEGYRVDFCWPELRVIVETDGWEAHGTRVAFQRDRIQTNRLQLAGYVVLRLTADDLTRHAARTARLIAVALAQASSKLRSMNVASMPNTSATINPR